MEMTNEFNQLWWSAETNKLICIRARTPTRGKCFKFKNFNYEKTKNFPLSKSFDPFLITQLLTNAPLIDGELFKPAVTTLFPANSQTAAGKYSKFNWQVERCRNREILKLPNCEYS